MWLLREKLSDFRVKQSYIELTYDMYTQKIAIIFDHIQEV